MSLEHTRFCVEVFMPRIMYIFIYLFIISFPPIEWVKLKTIRL